MEPPLALFVGAPAVAGLPVTSPIGASVHSHRLFFSFLFFFRIPVGVPGPEGVDGVSVFRPAILLRISSKGPGVSPPYSVSLPL